MLHLSQIHHIAIIVSDYQRSKDFYVNKLGFSIIRENYREARGDWKLDLRIGDGENGCGGTQLEIFGVQNPPKRPSYPEACGLRHLAFKVENVSETVKDLESRGIPCEPIRIDSFTNEMCYRI